VLQKINDNAYKIDLPGEYNVSATFNVTDLSPFEFSDYEMVDSRTNPLKERGDDVITRSTTHGDHNHEAEEDEDGVKTHSQAQHERDSQGSSTMDQAINGPAWRKDPLMGLGGPMTRSRAKKMKEALNGFILYLFEESKPTRVEEKPNIITLFKVKES
ncbi:hypothetical protein, partial [Candidatus Burkholderia verschuerenii]|uniref:hypothetical protein n=1 Tax=Candidatus Burkholderia verschuerenii TaxID=242163 RepID=UPI0018DEA787